MQTEEDLEMPEMKCVLNRGNVDVGHIHPKTNREGPVRRLQVRRTRFKVFFSAGNDFSMRGTSFSDCELESPPSLISRTRSRCSREAMMLSSSDAKVEKCQIMIGNAGQTHSNSLTRLLEQ